MIGALRDSGGLVELAARSLGCDPSLIYLRAKEDSSIDDAINSEREYTIDLAERNLREALIKKEQWATVHALRYLGAKRGYVEKQQLDVKGDVVVEIKWVEDDTDYNDQAAEDAPQAGGDLPPSGTV